MVKREGKIEKEIVWLLASGVTAYLVYRWYKKSQDGKTLIDSFDNAAGNGIDRYENDFGRKSSVKDPRTIQFRKSHPDYDRIPRSKIEAVVTSQSELSRLMGSVKSKGIQVPEQELTNVFNQYEEALKSGRQMPPRTIDVPSVQGKWTFGIWWRWPPGIKIKYEF